MRNEALFYEEYRRNISLFYEKNRPLEAETKKRIIDAVRELSKLAHLVPREGLLALEDASNSLEVTNLLLGNDLKRIIGFIVNGTEPDILEGIVLKRYFSRGLQGEEALFYLVYMSTCLEIQVGVRPDLIDEGLKALLPVEMENGFEEYLAKRDEERYSSEESFWDEMFGRTDYNNADGKVSESIRLIDRCIVSMSDTDMQRLNSKISQNDLAIYMKIMDGTAAKKLYDNLPSQRRSELYEYSYSLGPVRLVDVEKKAKVILKTIRRLEDEGEIVI